MRATYRLPDASSSPAGVGLGVLGFYVLMVFLGSWIATQYAASCLNYSVNLGEPLTWYIYHPWDFYKWWWRYRNMPVYRPIWRTGVHIIEVAHLAFAVAALWSVYQGKKLEKRTDAHGSSRWAETDDIKRAGFFTRKAGIIVGLWKPAWWRRARLLVDAGESHVAVEAPSRKGKDAGIVKPTLLTKPGTAIINDPKGEDYTETAGYWHQQSYKVLRVDPTCNDGTAARYNPLLAIRPYPQDVRDAQLLVGQIMDPAGTGFTKHWDRTAWGFWVGAALHQLYTERDKSIAGLLWTLTNPHYKLDDTLAYMMFAEHDPTYQYGWIDPTTNKPTKTHPVVASAVRAVLDKPEEERGSVISTLVGYLELYRDPTLAKNTGASDFDVSNLLDPSHPVRLYLTTPMSDLDRCKPITRIILHQFAQRLTEKLQTQPGSPKPVLDILLMLNEVASLGKLEFLTQGLSWLAGYGVRVCLILQDFSQLEEIYGKENSLLANCDTLVAFSPNAASTNTARKLSEMLGSFTYTRVQNSYSGSRFSPWLGHQIATTNEQKRELLTPDEIRRLPRNKELIFPDGQHPILANKVKYYMHPTLLYRSRCAAPTHSDTLTCDKYGWTQRPTPVRPKPQPKQSTGKTGTTEHVIEVKATPVATSAVSPDASYLNIPQDL